MLFNLYFHKEEKDMAVKMESITDKETGKVTYITHGTDIGKDVSEQLKSERNPDTSAISVADLKAIVADAEDYDAFVAAIEAL